MVAKENGFKFQFQVIITNGIYTHTYIFFLGARDGKKKYLVLDLLFEEKKKTFQFIKNLFNQRVSDVKYLCLFITTSLHLTF